MLYKIIKKRFLTAQVLLVLFILYPLGSMLFSAEELKEKLWYKHALQYIEADKKMIQNAMEKKETFLEDYSLRYEAELKLFHSHPPTALELIALLNSKDVLDKKVALVNIMNKKIDSEALFETILKQHDPKDDFLTKFYMYQCFKVLNRDKMKQFEDGFIKILDRENNESLIISAMPTLVQVESSKVIPLFVKYLKTGSFELKSASYIYLIKMGEKYLDTVKKILKEQKAIQALTFIKQAESGNKP